MFLGASAAIRSVDPEAEVVFGGLALFEDRELELLPGS
jgi:hypothetical protein